jgi:hypothetical protein
MKLYYMHIARALAWIFATYDLDDLDERDAAASLANIFYLIFFYFFVATIC